MKTKLISFLIPLPVLCLLHFHKHLHLTVRTNIVSLVLLLAILFQLLRFAGQDANPQQPNP
jgi:hypothetical protein